MKTFIAILFSLLTFTLLADSGRIVRVGYCPEPGVMDGAEPGAAKSGYAYEYLQEIASHAGWRYEYVYGNFGEIYAKLKSGEVDALPYLNYTEQRSKEFLFPDWEMGSDRMYIAAKSRKLLSDDLRELTGKSIGTEKGSYNERCFREFIEQKGIQCELVGFDSPALRWEAFADGKIDFSLEQSSMKQPEGMYAVYSLPDEHPYYLAVTPGRHDILAELNAAAGEIANDNPGFLYQLKVKYFSTVPLFKMLPEAAEKWLSEHKVIRIGSYDHQAPFVYCDDEGKVGGIAPDCTKLMFSALGAETPIEWVLFDGRQTALSALRAGQIDLIHPYYHAYSDAERDGVIISSSVFDAPFGILYQGDYTSETLSIVATPETRIGIQHVRDAYPNSKCIGCRNGKECVEKLLAGEANSVIMYMPTLQKIASEYDADLNIKALSTRCGVCFAALPKNAALIALVNKSLPYMNAVALNEIEDRHAIVSAVRISGLQFFKKHPAYIYGTAIALLLIAVAGMFMRRRTVMRYMHEIEDALQIAQAANRAKTEFLFNMSHDIRTPMNAIKGFTEIARKNISDTERVSGCLDKINNSGKILLSLINSVLDMSRIESGKMELNEIEADVFESFLGVESIMTEQANRKDLNISFNFENIRDRYVYADCDHGTRIFVNLISNAIKYTSAGGFVKIRCEQLPEDMKYEAPQNSSISDSAESRKTERVAHYRYTFADNGIGMSDEFQKHLYEQFTREQNSTTSGIQGTGLGLAITKKIIDLMGGTITCLSKQGKGTTFIVELPFRVREIGPNSQTDSEQANSSSLHFFSGRHALLVEDNDLNREIAMEILGEEGLIVDEANDGTKAVELLKEKGPDAYDFILMDIQMPTMNGYEATKAIRALYPNAKLPIIALSANAFSEDKRKSIEAGMNAHVAKPINIKELFATLAKFL